MSTCFKRSWPTNTSCHGERQESVSDRSVSVALAVDSHSQLSVPSRGPSVYTYYLGVHSQVIQFELLTFVALRQNPAIILSALKSSEALPCGGWVLCSAVDLAAFFTSWLCRWLAVWSWIRELPCCCFGFLVCIKGTVVPAWWGGSCEASRIIWVECTISAWQVVYAPYITIFTKLERKKVALPSPELGQPWNHFSISLSVLH